MSSCRSVGESLVRRSRSRTWIALAVVLCLGGSLAHAEELSLIATISAGHEPVGVAVSPDPDGAWVYVTTGYGDADDGLTVIDASSRSVAEVIRGLGRNPGFVALHPEGTYAYVTNAWDTTVSVIDIASRTVVATVEVGPWGGPMGVTCSPGGDRVYAANWKGDIVTVIDTASNSVAATITVGDAPYGVAARPDSAKVYVTHYYDGTVSVIDGATNTVVGTISVSSGAYGVAFSPDGARAYVSNKFDGTVSVIDAASDSVITTIGVGSSPLSLAVRPDGMRVYVTQETEHTIAIIDTASDAVVATVGAGGLVPRGIAVSPDGTLLYVANAGSNTVSVMEIIYEGEIGPLPPVAVHDAYGLNEGETLAVEAPGVLANDSDPNGDALTAVLVDDVDHGTLALNADGSFSYTPDTAWSGNDGFSYLASDGVLDSEETFVVLATTPVILHVDDDAPNDPGPSDKVVSDPLENGSVQHPFDTIQEALDAAVNGVNPKILVQPGTYVENINFVGKAVTLTSTIGPDDTWEAPAVAATIIDGNQADSVVTFDHGEGLDSVVTGFTIRNGKVTEQFRGGGGIACRTSSPTILSNRITANVAEGATSGDGGGIKCVTNSSPIIEGNVITENTASSNGGGIWCGLNSSPTIQDNTISRNVSTASGGGINVSSGASPMIRRNVIAANSTAETGGAVQCWTASPTISDNDIMNNTAGWGGAIAIWDSSAVKILGNRILSNSATTANGGGIIGGSSDVTIEGNSFSGNSAGSNGGGIACFEGNQWRISGNEFVGNTAVYGGAMAFGGQNTVPTITGNVLEENSAAMGGGIVIWSGAGEIRDNTFRDNHAVGDPERWSGGGAIHTGSAAAIVGNTFESNTAAGHEYSNGGAINCGDNSSGVISGNTFVGNSADSYAGGVMIANGSSPEVLNNTFSENTAAHGAAIGVYSNCAPVIRDNVMTGNTATSEIGGGALVVTLNCSPTIEANTITGNSGVDCAGITFIGSSGTVSGNTISDNTGAAITCTDYPGYPPNPSSPNIQGNTISGNTGDGVVIRSGLGVHASANSISQNGGLGIDLGGDGVTANDAADADDGPNDLQNYPVLASAESDGTSTVVTGLLESTANSTFRLEFFSNAEADPSGYGEGEEYIGFAEVATDGTGNAEFSATLPVDVAHLHLITSTATDPDGNTSEFSMSVPVNRVPVVQDTGYETPEDGAVTDQLPATDPDGDALTYTVADPPQHGQVVIGPDGTFTYTPDPDWSGDDSFSYQVGDGTGQSETATVSLTVAPVNDPPVAQNSEGACQEDAALVVPAPGVLDGATDIEGDPVHAVLVQGPAHGTLTLNPDGSYEYTPNPNYSGSDTFRFRANDGQDDGDVAVVALTVEPVNDAPSCAVGGPYQVNEGGAVQVSATGTDRDGDPLTYAWDLDGDDTYETPGQGVDFSAAALDGPSTHAISVQVSDPDGLTATAETTVEVQNVAPATEAGEGASLNEGDTFTRQGSFTDPGPDEWTATVDYGDGSGVQPLALNADKTFALSHTYADDDDDDAYTVVVTVTDDDGGTSSDELTVAVVNVAPELSAITAPVEPVEDGTTVEVSADFTDVGVLDTHTAEWDWGDESTLAGDVTEADGQGVATGSHSYDAPGVYTIKVTVTDDDGGLDESTYQYVVVYDPSGGFVTGGGWIDSPSGAYVADSSLEGKANFGFVSKYKKGATVPTGETEFRFRAGDLNFHSTEYQWLVVAGANAKFKGRGTINGEGDYGFMVTATDSKVDGGGATDSFRIKITDGDNVVYDNKMGDPDESDAGTEIGGGNIVVHKAK